MTVASEDRLWECFFDARWHALCYDKHVPGMRMPRMCMPGMHVPEMQVTEMYVTGSLWTEQFF